MVRTGTWFGPRRAVRFAAAAIVVVAVFAGVPAVVGAQETGDDSDVEVRIVARRHGDGRVEFGLQQGDVAGGWGERLLPRQRFFPPGTAVGRWLVSTPLALSAADTSTTLPPPMDSTPDDGVPPTSTTSPPGVDSTADDGVPPASTTSPPGIDSTADDDAPPTSTTTDTPGSQTSLEESLRSLVLDGVNELRGGSPPLVLDDGVTAAAQALAEAMADAADWQPGFDLAPHLQAEWDIWRRATSGWSSREPDDPAAARTLSRILLDVSGTGRAALECELCTHLGVGVATGHGRTYATVVVAGRAPAEDALAAAELEMTDLVNGLRVDLALEPLEYHADIAAVARRWSETMGAEEHLYHNPSYTEQYPAGWRRAGENASVVPGPLSLRSAVRSSFDGLVNSPGHYATMINADYTHLGVGIALDNGSLWVTQNFATYPSDTDTTSSTGTGTDPGTEPDNGSDDTDDRSGSVHRVRLSKGQNAQGVHSGCTSANCHFLRVELVDFEPGDYTVYCAHYGVPSAGWEPGHWVKYSTSNTTSEFCIWGVAGHAVYVLVEDPNTGEIVRSNDARWP